MAEEGLTRREVLRAGVGAAAAMAVGTPLLGQQQEIRCGFIGVGGRGTALLTETLKLPQVSVRAVCDINEANLNRALGMVQAARGARPAPYAAGPYDYRHLLDRRDLNAVVIATPCHWHAPMYLDAIAAGKHMYGEKPMCISVKEANAVVRAAQANPNLVVQIGFQRRANPHYQEAIALINQGEIGELLEARVAWLNAWGPLRGWFSKRAQSGDWVVEQACHTWDVLNWLVGHPPLRAYALGRADIYNQEEPDRDVYDYYTAILEYPEHFTVNATHSWICPPHDDFTGTYERVVGRLGGCDLGDGRFIYRDRAKPTREVGRETGDTFESLRCFFDSVATGKPPVSGVLNGRDAVLVGLMIRKSYDLRRVVTWEEIARSA